jgi:hypothetical protein
VTRWLRVVIQPSWLVTGLICAWLPYVSFLAVWFFVVGGPTDREVQDVGVLTLGVVATAYGLYRAVRFHPLCHPAYREWLARTPWAPDRPLPDGPVLLARQDAVVFALLGVPAWLVFGPAAWPLFPAFAIAYLLILAFTFIGTGPRVAVYLVLFGIVAMIGLAHIRLAVVGVALATYVVAAISFRQSLNLFPWEPGAEKVVRQRVTEAKQLGWPFDRLAPIVDPRVLRWWEGPTLALLVGCAVFAAGYQLERFEPRRAGDHPSDLLVLMPLVIILAAFCRLLAYMIGHLPPISLGGRLMTGRLLIPKYDVVFVAPLLAIVVMIVCPAWLPDLGLSFVAATAIGAGLAVAILAMVGPDRARWQLTAPARLVPVTKRPEKPRPPLPTLPPRR